MMRVVRPLAAMALVLALAGGAVWAGEANAPNADEVLQQLLDKAEAPERSPDELKQAYALAIGKLAEGLAVDDMSEMAGPDRQLETLCHLAAQPGREAHRHAAGLALVAELEKKSTVLGHTRLIRHIERIGGAEAVAALAERLTDKDLREPARRALARNPAPEASDALRAALPKADKPFRIGLIDALGLRRDAKAVDLLIAEAKSKDTEVRLHAVQALAQIGQDPATDVAAIGKVLANAAFTAESHGAARAALDAYIKLAEAVAARGKKADACTMYRSLLTTAQALKQKEGKGSAYPESVVASLLGPVKCAALIGMGRTGSAKEVDALTAALDWPATERAAARQGLTLIEGEAASKAIAEKVNGAQPEVQAILIRVLGDRGHDGIVPTVIEATKSKEEAVRLAAYQALGQLGSELAVQPLIGAMLNEKDALRDKAEWALSRIPGETATKAIVQTYQDLQPVAVGPKELAPKKVVLLRSLGYRNDPSVLPVLTPATRDPVEEVRVAAFRAIGKLNQVEAIPTILDGLRTQKGKSYEAAADALRSTYGPKATAAIVKAARTAPPAALAPILRVLSWREEPAVKEFLIANATDGEPSVRAAALDGLARVEAPEAVPAIIAAATEAEGEVRHAAVRTALQYADPIIKADPAKAQAVFAQAMDRKVIQGHRERNLAIQALGKVGGPDVVETICRVLRDRHVSRSAHDAVFRIAQRLAKAEEKDAAADALLTLARRSNDHGQIRRAQKELKKLGVEGELPQKAGFITRWHVCGPFSNDKNALFNKALPPETAERVDLSKPVTAAGVTRPWKAVHTTDAAGMVDLERELESKGELAALLAAEIEAPEATDVHLKLGYDEGCVAYLNGKKVHSRAGARFRIDDRRVKAKLAKGTNRILLKIVNLGPGWRATCRVLRPNDQPVPFTQKAAK